MATIRIGGATRMRGQQNNRIRIYVVESPSPLDVLAGVAEGPAVASIARLIGHQAAEFQVRSESDFINVCHYLRSCDLVRDESPDRISCMHISAHGSKRGLLLGGDRVTWESLAQEIQPFLGKAARKGGPRILVLSACMADSQTITKVIESSVHDKANIVPPRYLFCTSGSIRWDTAAVAWAVFYHFLPQVALQEKGNIQDILNKIAAIGLAKFVYFRWDEGAARYLKFAARRK